MKLFFLMSLLTFPFIGFSKEKKSPPLGDAWIEFGPFLYYDDDDDDLYDDNFYQDSGVNVWIGPGLYYGFWFDNEYQYRRWARDNYYYRHGGRGWNRGGHHHGDHGRHGGHRGSHGGGHGGGGHRH